MKKPLNKNIILITDIKEQLKNYPTPVSDSDEQFNYLLEERDRLQREITKDQSQLDNYYAKKAEPWRLATKRIEQNEIRMDHKIKKRHI